MRHKLRLTGLRQRGDTIVEVLIAISIISFLITGAFSITRQSLANERQAQELGEALELTQSQIESLKDYLNTNTSPSQTFCIYNDAVVVLPTGGISAGSDCALNTSGIPTTVEPVYNVAITPSPQANNIIDFTVETRWNSINQKGTDTNAVTLYYQLYTQ
jgi:type II secretory pathway pseudopilin PulG